MSLVRLLLLAGLLYLAVAFGWPWLRRLGFGSLPGDVVIQAGERLLHFPFVTAFLVAGAAGLLVWFVRR